MIRAWGRVLFFALVALLPLATRAVDQTTAAQNAPQAALVPPAAEEPKDFRVMTHTLNAEASSAEICLTFSQPIDSADRGALASVLKLEKDGAKMPVAARDLSLTPLSLCVQQLEHRHRYRLVLRNLHDKNGKTLAGPATFSFTVPDRKASLTFSATASSSGLPRYGKAEEKFPLVIRAVNVAAAQLTLYRFPDRKTFADAWAQAGKLNLAPSESLYFATQKGQVAWQSELKFGDQPNVEQNLEAPLPPRKELTPGLYFLAVAPPTANPAGPVFMAGQWFLVSDLKLTAVTSADGAYVFAADAAAKQISADVPLQLLAADGHVLAEARSGKDGTAFLAFAKDQKTKPALVTGMTASGDADILDLTRVSGNAFSPLAGEATIIADRDLYRPGSTATVTLAMMDEKGRPGKTPASTLKLIRPDQSLFSEQTVSAGKTGALFIAVALPAAAETGEWTLLWQQADGAQLARATIRLGPDGTWPKLTIAADRGMLESDGAVTLTVKAADERNKPLPWRSGRVEARLSRPEFTGWKNYQFGAIAPENTEPIARTGFLTLDQGTAHVRMQVPLTGRDVPAQAVTLTARMDHRAAPVTLTLPVESSSGWVGLRPLPDARPFAENSVAAFDVIAVDNEGKRRGAGELFYQIYEEGRSFDWFQAGGRWNYQPLPQHRRVGGGRLTVAASGANRIQWPVTAGHYLLEMTGGDGAVLAQYRFDAGGNPPPLPPRDDRRLTLQAHDPALKPGQNNAVILKLAEPAMVSVLIGDNRVRQTVHRFMAAGDNVIEIAPTEDWDARVQIQARALFASGDEAAVARTLPLHHGWMNLALAVKPPAAANAGAALVLPVVAQNVVNSKQTTYVSALATPIETESGNERPSVIVPAVPVERDGRAALRLQLPDFSGTLNLTLTAWNEQQYATKTIAFPAQPAVAVKADPPERLFMDDRSTFTINLENKAGPAGVYAYTLTPPPGIRLEGARQGAAVLKKGQSRALPLELTVTGTVWGNFKLDLKGPNNFLTTRVWPLTAEGGKPASLVLTAQMIEPRQSLTLSSLHGVRSFEGFALVSAAPIPDLPRQWRALLMAEPFTSEQVARWLDATRLWQKDMTASGLISGEALQQRRAQRLRQLEERQNNDGGFPPWPSSGASDLASTAAALLALQGESSVAASQATAWLQRRLENTWFEESERPARASGFLALSITGHADLSGLRYFADTSRDKQLPPVAMAELALALAQNHDDESARFWLQQARAAAPRLLESKSMEIWPLLQRLVANALLNPREVTADVERASADIPPVTPEQSVAALQALDAMVQRFGSWRLVVNGKERKVDGVISLPLPDKAASLSLRNPMENKIFVVQVEEGNGTAGGAKAPGKTGPTIMIERQLFRLDGAPVDPNEPLTQNQMYVLLIHGTGKLDETSRMMPLVITSPSSSGLQLMRAGNADPQTMLSSWPWLSTSLTSPEGVVSTAEGTSFVLQPSNDWRVVCLVKAGRSGTYALPPVIARGLSGNSLNVTQEALRWTVR